jgi:hypothetical protein
MSNCIYLKLPWYVAAHFRGRNEDHYLTEWEPMKFSVYTNMGRLLENELRYIPEQNQSRLCYSQRVWNNILNGKLPTGGKVILTRDPKEWPTAKELCTLTGTTSSKAQDAKDYLCIEMPREVWMAGRPYRTNSCYSLSYDVASHLVKMLTDMFWHEVIDWTYQDWAHCVEYNIQRKQLERFERYLTQFNFPAIIDSSQREALRRMYNRKLKEADMMPNRGKNFGHSFLQHISDDEWERNEERHKRLIRKERKQKES